MSLDEEPAGQAASVAHAARARGEAPDPLAAFPTEAQVAATAAGRIRRRRLMSVGLIALAGGAILTALAVWAAGPAASARLRRVLGTSAASPDSTLVIQTTPSGWNVNEGDRPLGITPLKVSLAPGKHSLLLQKGTASRPLDVVLTAGGEVVHHLDLPAEPPAGTLRVATSPPGAVVTVDGVNRGKSPVDVAGLAPGDHSVALTNGNRVINERVTVTAGGTAMLVVPIGQAEAPAPSVGWVTIAAGIELQVYEGDSLVGSSRNQRIMLMPGRHTLRVVNAALGFEGTSAVTIESGAVAKIAVQVPNGRLSVNAVPWAEVVLDGTVIGETPIANQPVSLGSHELVLRNPRFAERRQTIVVTLTAPVRVGIDLRQ